MQLHRSIFFVVETRWHSILDENHMFLFVVFVDNWTFWSNASSPTHMWIHIWRGHKPVVWFRWTMLVPSPFIKTCQAVDDLWVSPNSVGSLRSKLKHFGLTKQHQFPPYALEFLKWYNIVWTNCRCSYSGETTNFWRVIEVKL